MKVLLAGNDAKQQKVIQACLNKDDYEVVVDKKGDKILDLIEKEAPELVIADYDMQDGGVNLINNILILPDTLFPYILFLIKEEDEQSVISSLGPIPGDFVIKPVKESELQARIAVAEKAIALKKHLGDVREMGQDLAMYDELTNVMNRQAVYEQALGELNRAQRETIQVCLAMIELVDIEDINAGNGVEAGNLAIRSLARAIRSNVRMYDLVGRWIGPKFFLMLPGLPQEHTRKVIERVYGAVSTLRVRLAEGENLPVAVAIGYTLSFPDTTEHLYTLIEQANLALEKARKIKKDARILVYSPEVESG